MRPSQMSDDERIANSIMDKFALDDTDSDFWNQLSDWRDGLVSPFVRMAREIRFNTFVRNFKL